MIKIIVIGLVLFSLGSLFPLIWIVFAFYCFWAYQIPKNDRLKAFNDSTKVLANTLESIAKSADEFSIKVDEHLRQVEEDFYQYKIDIFIKDNPSIQPTRELKSISRNVKNA